MKIMSTLLECLTKTSAHLENFKNVCSPGAHEDHVYPLGVLDEDVYSPGELEEDVRQP
jgi:hypothetical protein